MQIVICLIKKLIINFVINQDYGRNDPYGQSGRPNWRQNGFDYNQRDPYEESTVIRET